MQIQAQEKEGLVKLSELADNINQSFKESFTLSVEAIKGGRAAVKAAARTGGLLTRAKKVVGHGNWLKWLADNCPEICPETARKWMALSNSNLGLNLTQAAGLTDAYRAIGIIPEREEKKTGIGTAPVDIFAELFRKFDRGLGPVIDISSGVDPADMPPEQRAKLIERAQPMIDFVDRVKAVGV